MVFPERRLTWGEFEAEVRGVARSLCGLGVAPGDHVATMLPNSADCAVALVAIMAVGACAVPINLRAKQHELAHLMCDSDSVVLLTAGQVAGGAGEWSADSLVPGVFPELSGNPATRTFRAAPRLRSLVWLRGQAPSGGLSREEFDEAGRSIALDEVDARQAGYSPSDTAIVMYTSGTTARPKGAMISHAAVVAQAECIGSVAFRLTGADRFWTPLPMFHTGGIMSLMACIAAGATYCHVGVFSADTAIDQLEQERVSVAMPVFEPMWLPVLDHPRFATANLENLRLVQTAGVPETQRAMQARFPQAVNLQSSGMTESTSYFAINRPEDPAEIRLGTGGYPLPTVEVRITDPATGRALPQGEQGETQLRGIGMFSGYHNADELTSASFTDDGWFRTGDVGRLDEAGRYTFLGRYKDILKVGGENVSAAEVEDYLSHHPAVRLTQVVAAPDGTYTEVPAAFVELRAGLEATERELIDFCLGHISTYKVPRYVRFVTEWPMSGTKIQKFRLREMIAEELRLAGIESAPKLTARA